MSAPPRTSPHWDRSFELAASQAGMFSHQTALALHGHPTAAPAVCHPTLPEPWRKCRLMVPAGAALHFADITAQEVSR